MFRQFDQFGANGLTDASRPFGLDGTAIAQSGQLDALVALERIGSRRSFARDEEIYAEGDPSDGWYKVVSGTVRISKLLADGRRHIAEFCFGGDCFGFENISERVFSAEAVGKVIVMRYPRRATERLIDENPLLARAPVRYDLARSGSCPDPDAVAGADDCAERVASFLLEMSERRDTRRVVDLPMSRNDIADYLGLTIETVCRVLSAFKRAGSVAIPNPHRIELRDLGALEAVGEA